METGQRDPAIGRGVVTAGTVGMALLVAALILAPASPVQGQGPAIGGSLQRLAAADSIPGIQDLVDRYFEVLVRVQPVRAGLMGLHGGDAFLGPSGRPGWDAARKDWRELEARILDRTTSFLTPDDRFDLALMLFDVRRQVFELDSLRVWTRNPLRAVNHVASGISLPLQRMYASPEVRLRAVLERELQVPRYLREAESMLDRPPRALVEQAVVQADALSNFLLESVPAAADRLQDPELAHELLVANEAALEAVREYRNRLQGRLRAGTSEEFALGAELLSRWLYASEGLQFSAEEMAAIAERELARLDAEFRRVAAEVDSTLAPAEVMLQISYDHPEANSILTEMSAILDEARRFVEDAGLVRMPAVPRILVRATPGGARWSNASLATPGPFEPVGSPAIFYLTLPRPFDSDEDRLALLRFFNRPLLRNLAVHEGYPGHYVQGVIQEGLSRPVRKAVMSHAFVEGWAHYAEDLMLETGYQSHDSGFRLATLQSGLRRAGRLRVAVGLHAEGWTVDQAAAFLEERCYLEPVLARREAERGLFDPLYLVYTLGRIEVRELRQAVEEQEGTTFDLRAFHDRLLELGTPPLPLARARMLGAELPARGMLD